MNYLSHFPACSLSRSLAPNRAAQGLKGLRYLARNCQPRRATSSALLPDPRQPIHIAVAATLPSSRLSTCFPFPALDGSLSYPPELSSVTGSPRWKFVTFGLAFLLAFMVYSTGWICQPVRVDSIFIYNTLLPPFKKYGCPVLRRESRAIPEGILVSTCGLQSLLDVGPASTRAS